MPEVVGLPAFDKYENLFTLRANPPAQFKAYVGEGNTKQYRSYNANFDFENIHNKCWAGAKAFEFRAQIELGWGAKTSNKKKAQTATPRNSARLEMDSPSLPEILPNVVPTYSPKKSLKWFQKVRVHR